jgi:hypothetical protein
MEVPVPEEFIGKDPVYEFHSIDFPVGAVDPNDPWLIWNRILIRDVHGGYSKALTDGVTAANPEARIGPIPGGMQMPLFAIEIGQYPPMNFGPDGFNMLSYYMYYRFWRPNVAYVYYTELARMNNRDMLLYVMPESLFPEESYSWNNFFLLLAAGVDGLAYFIDQETTPEFASVARYIIGPIAEKFGPMLVKLQPTKRKVGHLVSFTNANYQLLHPVYSVCSFTNLLMSHIDAEPVAEEEILAGKPYDAIILGDIDWLRSDVISELSDSSKYPLVILDKDTEVAITGNHVQTLNFSLLNGNCAGADPDYGVDGHLDEIRIGINNLVPPDVQFSSDTTIFRKYHAGDALYVWLVDVHTRDEYMNMWRWAQNGGIQSQGFLFSTGLGYEGDLDSKNIPAALRQEFDGNGILLSEDATVSVVEEGWEWLIVDSGEKYTVKKRDELNIYNQGNVYAAKKFLRNSGVYGSTTSAQVELKTSGNYVVVNVFDGDVLSASYNNRWMTFNVKIPRLQGRLIALYPAAPNSVQIDAPNVPAGEEVVLSATILDASNTPIQAVFPIQVELLDPNGEVHTYSRYTATDATGSYSLPVLIGENAPKGTWILKVAELSTNIQNSATFVVSSGGDTIVYIMETGSKYHRAGCRYLSKKRIPISKSEAIKQGYAACSVCKP